MWPNNSNNNVQNFEGNQFNYGHSGQSHRTPSQHNIYEGLAAEMLGSDAFRTLFLGDLSYFCTEEDLCAIFAPFGNISTVRVRRGVTGESLMHGFIALDSHEAAKRAIAELDSKIFMGRSMRVQLSSEGPRPSAPKEGLVQIHVSFISKQLNFLVTEVVLREIFAPFGRIADVAVRRHTIVQKQNRQSGYGFVYFLDIEAACAAMSQLKQNTVREITFDCSISHKSEHFGRSPTSSNQKSVDFNNQNKNANANNNNNNGQHNISQNNASNLRGIARSVSDSFSPQNHGHFNSNNPHSSVATQKSKNDLPSNNAPSLYIPQQGNQGQQPPSLFWGNNASANSANNGNHYLNNKSSVENVNNTNNNGGLNNSNPHSTTTVPSLTALSAGSTPRTQGPLSNRVGSGDSYLSSSYMSLQSFPSTNLSAENNESLSNKMMLLSPTWANGNNAPGLSSHSSSNSTINTPISQHRHLHPSFANTSGNFSTNGASTSGNESLLGPNSLGANSGSSKSSLTATAPEFVPASFVGGQQQQPQVSTVSGGSSNGMFSRLSAFSNSNDDGNMNLNNISNVLPPMVPSSDDTLLNFSSFAASLPSTNANNGFANSVAANSSNSPTSPWSTMNNNSSLLSNNSAVIGSGLSSSVASSYTSQQSNSLLLSSSLSLGLLDSNATNGGGNRSRHGSSHSAYSLFDSYAYAQNGVGSATNSNASPMGVNLMINTAVSGPGNSANTLSSPVLSSGHTSSGSSLSTLNLTSQNLQNALLQGKTMGGNTSNNGINVNGNNMFLSPPSSNVDALAVSNMSSLMMDNVGNKSSTSLLHHNIVGKNNLPSNQSFQSQQNNGLLVDDDPFAFVIPLNNSTSPSSSNTNNVNNNIDNNTAIPSFLQLGAGMNAYINNANHSYSI